AAGGEKREYRIVRQREATAGVRDEEPLRARDREWHRRMRAAIRGRRRRQQAPRHEGRQPLAETDFLVEVILVLHAELPEHGMLHLGADLLEREAEFPECLVEEPLAERDGLSAAQALKVMPDGVARLRGDDEVDPRGIGHRAFGG